MAHRLAEALRVVPWLAAGIATTPAPSGAALLPSGDAVALSESATGSTQSPHVAALPGGGFVVVWRDPIETIQARFVDSNGQPQGADLLVHAAPSGTFVFGPDVETLPTGGFVVAWEREDTILARIHDASGSPLGPELVVPTSGSIRGYPDLAATDDGSFVVAWTGIGAAGGDGDGASIQARGFASDGTPLGVQFRVNRSTLGDQVGASVAIDRPGGTVLFAWFDEVLDAIREQIVSAGGELVGPERSVNASGSPRQPRVAASDRGEFVVAWLDVGPFPDGPLRVRGRRLRSDTGDAVGDEFEATSPGFRGGAACLPYPPRVCSLSDPSVAVSPGGEIAVVWTATTGTDVGRGVVFFDYEAFEGQAFSPSGEAIGGTFHIGADLQLFGVQGSGLSVAPDGQTLAVWGGSDAAVGRLLIPAIFGDGFESGDTTSWSAQVAP